MNNRSRWTSLQNSRSLKERRKSPPGSPSQFGWLLSSSRKYHHSTSLTSETHAWIYSITSRKTRKNGKNSFMERNSSKIVWKFIQCLMKHISCAKERNWLKREQRSNLRRKKNSNYWKSKDFLTRLRSKRIKRLTLECLVAMTSSIISLPSNLVRWLNSLNLT